MANMQLCDLIFHLWIRNLNLKLKWIEIVADVQFSNIKMMKNPVFTFLFKQ